MTKRDIIREASIRFGTGESLSRAVVQFVFDAIVQTLEKEGRIELRNFGVFEVKTRAARTARNPRTNTPLRLPAKSVVTFQPGKRLANQAAAFETAVEKRASKSVGG